MNPAASEPQSDARSVVFWRNKLTFAGAILAYAAILFLGCFFLIGLLTPVHNPYVGLWFYLVLPGVLVVGLLLMPLGTLVEWRKQRRAARRNGDPGKPLRLDLNLPHHRKVLKFVIVTTVFVVPVVATTTYQGYHYTDSTDFCAKVCHTVMEPQYVAQQRSPHARVPCVECHIGSGAEWYVKSKLSGARQVLAVARNSYHRPIPPAITELRPAVETCQECHWPEKFYGDQLVRIAHYANDEGNSPRHVEMIVKTGGGDPKHGPARGIHWHMALSNRIEYVATDEGLQDITWVRQVTADGRSIVYRRDGLTGRDPKPDGIERTVDCMDCHNRAAHDFHPPLVALDLALDSAGMIDRSLPYIKREAIAALVAARTAPDNAPQVIDRHINEFYRREYPRVARDSAASVRQAVIAVSDIFRTTFFPRMSVDWRTYPNNIGHKNFPGCFRCHNGDMVSDDGTAIQRTCASCHVFLEVQSADAESSLIRAGRFAHPVPLMGVHATTACSNCHNGGVPPATSCASCHTVESGLAAGTLPELQRFGISAGPLANHSCEACHDLSKPRDVQAIASRCTTCHNDAAADHPSGIHAEALLAAQTALVEARRRAEAALAEVKASAGVASQARADPLAYAGGRGDERSNSFAWLEDSASVMRLLDQASAIHNPDAAITVYDAIVAHAQGR